MPSSDLHCLCVASSQPNANVVEQQTELCSLRLVYRSVRTLLYFNLHAKLDCNVVNARHECTSIKGQSWLLCEWRRQKRLVDQVLHSVLRSARATATTATTHGDGGGGEEMKVTACRGQDNE